MATLIRRAEVLKRVKQMEENCADAGDKDGAKLMVKVYNAVMSCKVENRVFCAQCGEAVKTAKIPKSDGGA